MRSLTLVTLLGATVGSGILSSGARAETFTISYQNRASADPAETFEADCLGATEAPDCAVRAAALEAELVEMLGELEGLRDDDTQSLFRGAVSTDSPAVREIGLRYFARSREVPNDLWTNVKAFFLGPDPAVGQASAELLAMSTAEVDQEMSDLFLELRSGDRYGDYVPDETGGDDPWAEACADDALLDEVASFPEAQRFAPASRLLMIDRFIESFSGGMVVRLPVTGFVTDADKATVTAHFSKVFGKQPFPPAMETASKLEALNLELASLTERIQRGDQSAGARLQQVLDELTALQQAAGAWQLLQLDEEQCADCVVWLDGKVDDLYTMPLPRAVAVGTDPLLDKTVIRYVNAASGVGSQPNGDSDAGVVQHDGGSQGATTDAGTVTPAPAKKSDGGCSTTGNGSSGLWLLALALLRRKRS